MLCCRARITSQAKSGDDVVCDSALLTLIAYVRMTSFALFRQIAVEKTRLSSSDWDGDQAVPEIGGPSY